MKFTSSQAPGADCFVGEVARFIGERLGIRVEVVLDIPWQEREQRFDRGDIDVCWMCGWPYALRADGLPASVDPIAAPVMAEPRYDDRPVYFSDVVVRADSAFTSFEDLRGTRWAFNEPRSHSGYNVVRHFMASRRIAEPFFSSMLESGAHQTSIDLIASGEVDASAVDSTVLEAILRRRPELRPLLRVIETIGPSPAPPWVARASLPRHLRDALRTQFATMHEFGGRAILESAGVKRFAAVGDADYDAIRHMAAVSSRFALTR